MSTKAHNNITINNLLFYLALVSLYTIINLITKSTLQINHLIELHYSEQLSIERIHSLIEAQEKFEWIGLLIFPLVILFKLFIINTLFKLGGILFNIQLKKTLKTVIIAEYIFLLSIFTKYIILYFNSSSLNLEFIYSYQPLSLSNLFPLNEIEKWLLYPLQTINAFEILYWFTLSWVLSKELKLKFWKSFEFVMSTYGVGLLIWVVFVMFLTINMS